MTNYTVYFKVFKQPMERNPTFPAGDVLYEIGSVEMDKPKQAIKKVVSRYDPEDFLDEFRGEAEGNMQFVAIADGNENEEIAHITDSYNPEDGEIKFESI